MNSPLKIGLIGVGYLGNHHLNHLLDIEGVTVSGFWDINSDVRNEIHSKFGVYAANNLQELIELSDAIDIVTPTSTHFSIANDVINAKRSVFIEKPLTATVSEGAELVKNARNAGVQIQVGHIERFNKAFRALKSTNVSPQFIEAHRLSPWSERGADVAVVLDLMIHDLDLVLSLADGSVTQVHASGVGVVTDSVDIATARIEFEGGLVANITASRISLKRMRKLRIFGRHEYIALDLNKGQCEYVGVVGLDKPIPENSSFLGDIGEGGTGYHLYHRFLTATDKDALKLELEAFRDSVTKGTPPPVSGSDGLKALELAERIVSEINDRKQI